MSKEHIVVEGDCIASIAFENGFHPKTLWEHPQNTALREKRLEATVLMPGDVVFIPDLRRKYVKKATEAEHVFKLKAYPEMLKIRFLDTEDRPRSGRIYVINIDGDLRRGRTDGEGFVKEMIPPNAMRAHLTLYEDDEAQEKEEYDIAIGHLQPITEPAGVSARLAGLGYLTGGKEASDEQMRRSITNFQQDYDLASTGELNDETRRKLQEMYGA